MQSPRAPFYCPLPLVLSSLSLDLNLSCLCPFIFFVPYRPFDRPTLTVSCVCLLTLLICLLLSPPRNPSVCLFLSVCLPCLFACLSACCFFPFLLNTLNTNIRNILSPLIPTLLSWLLHLYTPYTRLYTALRSCTTTTSLHPPLAFAMLSEFLKFSLFSSFSSSFFFSFYFLSSFYFLLFTFFFLLSSFLPQ